MVYSGVLVPTIISSSKLDVSNNNQEKIFHQAQEFSKELLNHNILESASEMDLSSDGNLSSDRYEELQEKIKLLDDKNESLRDELSSYQQYCMDLRKEIEVINPMLESGDSTVQALRHENISLKIQLENATKNYVSTEELATDMSDRLGRDSTTTSGESLSLQTSYYSNNYYEELCGLKKQLESLRNELATRGNYKIKVIINKSR